MTMHTIQIEYPDDILANADEEQLKALAREAFYAKLYEQGLLSSGRAAQLLGITRWDFLDLLGHYGVSYFDDTLDQGPGRAQP
jgi:predicted HTH domain antitoxin